VPHAFPPVGDRIREERVRRGLSLRGLARNLGVSASLISQIETGRSRPSVSTLYAISRELDISLDEVFDASDETAVPSAGTVIGTLPSVAHALAASGADLAGEHAQIGPHVPREGRELLELDSGVTWERLGRVPGVHVDFILATYAPGGRSSSSGQLMRHQGVEYGYLISGELTLTLGFDEHKVTAGDSVSFASTTPHSYRNDGSVPAVGVWCVVDTDP
jgi:transcriptional regulator with XRE-family HTH domain